MRKIQLRAMGFQDRRCKRRTTCAAPSIVNQSPGEVDDVCKNQRARPCHLGRDGRSRAWRRATTPNTQLRGGAAGGGTMQQGGGCPAAAMRKWQRGDSPTQKGAAKSGSKGTVGSSSGRTAPKSSGGSEMAPATKKY